MLISITNLAILPVIDKRHDKEVLRNVFLKEGYVYGTDSHSLYRSKLPEPDLEDEYPVIDAGESNLTSNMVPAQLLEKAEKDLPKKGTYPIITEHVCVTETEKHISVSTTDLDTTTSHKARKVQGSYPNVKAVEPEFDSPIEIILSLENLKKLVQVADKAKKAEAKRQNKKMTDGEFGIELTIEGDTLSSIKPIKVKLLETTDEVSGIIMPMVRKVKKEGM